MIEKLGWPYKQKEGDGHSPKSTLGVSGEANERGRRSSEARNGPMLPAVALRATAILYVHLGCHVELRSSARGLFRHKCCALKALCVTHHHLKQVAGQFGLVHADGFRV